MLEASPLPSLLIRTADRSCAAVNDAYIEGFGWLRDELLGESCDRFWVVPDQYAHLLERLRLDGRVRNSECLARRKSGEQRNLLVSLEPIVLNQASDEIPNQYLDCSKARRMLEWRPRFSFEEALGETIAWYRARLTGSSAAVP